MTPDPEPRAMEITISAPDNFSFRRTALSHGWYDLPPFYFDERTWTLTRVIDLPPNRPVTVEIRGDRRSIRVSAARKLGRRSEAKVIRDVRHMFRLDDDMTSFYAGVRDEPEFRWIAESGAGRLLRAPTVFEDLVKTLCTTNCSWALTSKMVAALVDTLGAKTEDGRRSFPTAEAMASVDETFYREQVRAGYRAPYLKELAERVASGTIDVESWLESDLATSALNREIRGVKGVGQYSAENLLRLIGRYDGLALDSWVRAEFAKKHNGGRKASDKKIARSYKRFGEWSGLAFWCDMTHGWLSGDEDGKW